MRLVFTLFLLLVCLLPLSAQQVPGVPATTPGSNATPGWTVTSFDGQYIYYNDDAGVSHRIAVTPVQSTSNPIGTCNGQSTAVNTTSNSFFYCLNGAWTSLISTAAPGTISGGTPTVSGSSIVLTNNTSPTIVTTFMGGTDGQLLSVVCRDLNTSIANETTSASTGVTTGNILTATSGTITCNNLNAVFTFLYSQIEGEWIQISSSYNAGSTSIPITGQSSQGQFIATNLGSLTGTPAVTYNFNTNIPSIATQLNVGNPSVAFNLDFYQGPIPSVTPNAVGLSAPPQVQASGLKIFLPGFFGGGIWSLSPNTPYVQSFASGDVNHSISRQTGVTASVRNTVICDFSYCQQGSFIVTVDAASALVCATPGPAAVQFFLTFTDDVGTKTNVPIPLVVNGGATNLATMALGDAVTWSHGMLKFYNGGANNISISSSLTGCTSGTATYNWDAEVIEVQ
jgi:hypothetical protein